MPESDHEILIADVLPITRKPRASSRWEKIVLMTVTMVGTYEQTGFNIGTYCLDTAMVMDYRGACQNSDFQRGKLRIYLGLPLPTRTLG